tara:strand:+ start:222 stop:623 length:402 start_codon:yes stop_codon:yes gene_type:complete
MNIKDLEKEGFILQNGKWVKKRSYNKYRNTKTKIDGINFDSQKEANYYSQLKLLERANEILKFERQVKMPIEVNGFHIAFYILDFKVYYPCGNIEHIDIKAKDKKTNKWITTDVFKLKKKLIEAIYKIKIILI